ncbi:hypothetical protein DCAR_0518923 [Daucus carota subsp. sativus]|uniref:Uncharacterized protein n=1 Tax=Daucus carota subsp. sativus TaxID=79200 RepID=A0A164XL34_DAUCS|nr:hypothetical protein DCAR_0518923 [Daucus carota subsp. sativus]
MNIHWIPPPTGTIEVNVHGTSLQAPAKNVNTSKIGAILRRSNGSMTSSLAGTIPNLSPVVNSSWKLMQVCGATYNAT